MPSAPCRVGTRADARFPFAWNSVDTVSTRHAHLRASRSSLTKSPGQLTSPPAAQGRPPRLLVARHLTGAKQRRGGESGRRIFGGAPGGKNPLKGVFLPAPKSFELTQPLPPGGGATRGGVGQLHPRVYGELGGMP